MYCVQSRAGWLNDAGVPVAGFVGLPMSWPGAVHDEPPALGPVHFGGVTLAVARKLIDQGRIPRDEEIVLCITGNGLKTQDAVADYLEKPAVINPSLEEFEPLVETCHEAALV